METTSPHLEQDHQSAPPEPAHNGAPPGSPRTFVKRLTRLSANEQAFRAWGIARVKATQGDEGYLEVPIKAVEIEEVRRAVEHLRPKVPTYRDKIKGQWVTILDEANDGYLRARETYQAALGRVWVLLALDIDVTDKQDVVVWSADNTVQRFDAAVDALRESGITDQQLTDLLTEVQNLTTQTEEQTTRD